MKNNLIIIPNLEMGNYASIKNMLKKCGADCLISDNPDDIQKCNKLILSGVGSFDTGIQLLKNKNWFDKILKFASISNNYILGICLGMQLLCKKSEEGILDGLGLIDANVTKINSQNIKVPHMGWNIVKPVKNNLLIKHTSLEQRFYFVHSYKVVCNKKSNIIAKTFYDSYITAIIQNDNIFGVQFHPEKSHRFGQSLMNNFVEF